MTRYTGVGPRSLHTVGEGRAPKIRGSHDDALAQKLLGDLGHLGFLLGRLGAGGRLLRVVQQHVKQLLHVDIRLGGGLHEGAIPLQREGSAVLRGQLPAAAVVAFVAHQHDRILTQVSTLDLADQLVEGLQLLQGLLLGD